MTCREFEPLIALYAGSDLDTPDLVRVDEHLARCAGCRALLEDLQASRESLLDWGSEPVEGALLTAIRSGALARIGARRRRVWPWIAAAAACAALAALLTVGAPPKAVPAPPPPERGVEIAEKAEAPPPASRPAPRRRRVKRAPVIDGEPLIVKMLTDDPDIVIIWLVDQKGD